MQIFSMDNAFFRFMGRLTDLVWVNILTLICCLPVVTAGAALSAMYKVLIKMAMEDAGGITRMYFEAFKSNFKEATKLWVPSALILFVMLSNAWILHQGIFEGNQVLLTATGISIGIITVLVVLFQIYALSLLAFYDNTLKQTVKNAFLLMLAYFPRSICMIVILLFPLALMMISNWFLFLWGLYGLTVCLVAVAVVVIGIFIKSVLIPEPISDICVLILYEDMNPDDTQMIQDELEVITGKSVDVVSYGATAEFGRDAFAVKLTTDQLDIVLAPYEETMQMIQSGYLTGEQVLEYSELHLGIPQKARKGEALNLAIDYFKTCFGKR